MKLIEEIKDCEIDLSDLTVNENFCLYESNVNEIHGLIGADYVGKLFTWEIKNLPSGLVAMNTYFGWTTMGRTGEGCSASEVLLSLHVSDLKICDLWSLDLLGIKEPSISQSKSEIEEAVKDHFVRSLRRDDEGRYQVSLPWLEVHPELSDNRNIAERRLKSCVRSLQKRNCLQEVSIFKEWVSEKIIESVEPEELAREKGHFLPHRPVFKENSTTRIRPVFDASAKERNLGSLNDCKVTRMYKGIDGRVRVVEVKTQFGSVMRPIQKLYPLEVTTADSLSSTERDVENGSCLDQDQIPEVQGVLRSRYGRLLKQTKRLDNP
ncbi:integrase catalytic domain-containing protein [Trichonephila clavata]|uniref:Integrase catalytic domain-containing protein n=1 Tax=Trichonephila clavata TaxID=2740835 RepID=A0A8X6IQ64_TRICU|nr:integrase catalytic domain-containing protein [Trichonephila clavata]